ncbi:leucine-rich repeat protein, partial [Hoylesella marshii]
MKRILIVCCAIFVALAGRAQSSSWTDPTGAQFDFTITDPVNKLAKITKGNGAPGTTVITVPGTVPYNGDTYKVTDIAGRVTWVNNHVYNNGLKKLILSENIKVLRSYSVDLNFDLEEIVFPSTLEVIGSEACTHLHSLKGVDLSHTKVKYIDYGAFNANLSQISYIKFPQTLRRLDFGICIQSNPPLKKLELPAQLDTLSYGTFNGLYQLEEISFTKPTPALLYTTNPVNPTYGPYNPFRDLTNLQVVHLPVDATAAYKSQPYWADGANLYREELAIGSTGYTTYYLENENFLVPTGCTAYIITGITPSGKHGVPGTAHAQAFGAGKIIPKQTGFILQGTANSTITYQANVTGTEENVTGNLLVGTATEQEFSSASYKYYIFSNSGDQGLGFYKQGTRDGASIKLKPHRAGLRLPAGVAPAKG